MAVKLCFLILPDPLENMLPCCYITGGRNISLYWGWKGGGDKKDRDHLSAQDCNVLEEGFQGSANVCIIYLFASARLLAQTTFFIVYKPVVSKLPNFACTLNSRKIINNRRII